MQNNFFSTKLDILDILHRSEYECNNIMVELSIDEIGIVNITAKTKNDQIYTVELPVESNDGHLNDARIKELNNDDLNVFFCLCVGISYNCLF